jgi:predicted nucleic acid-binding protein
VASEKFCAVLSATTTWGLEAVNRQAGKNRQNRVCAFSPAILPLLGGRKIEEGWKIQDRYQLSFWDALIVAAAKTLACSYLLIEDFQADQDLDGVLIVNPFVCNPDSLPPR